MCQGSANCISVMSKCGYWEIQNLFFWSTFCQQVLPSLVYSSFIFIKHVKRLLDNSANLSVLNRDICTRQLWKCICHLQQAQTQFQKTLELPQSNPRILYYLFCIPAKFIFGGETGAALPLRYQWSWCKSEGFPQGSRAIGTSQSCIRTAVVVFFCAILYLTTAAPKNL